MIEDWRRRRAAKRITSGDGRALKRLRWWQLPFRALFYLALPNGDGRQTVYAVDIPRRTDPDGGKAKAHLYLDGRHHAESKLPAAFPVEGGTIEVAISAFGLKRCHYVTAAGAEHRLIPDPRSAEGRRARVEREHPTLSRSISLLSVLMLVIGVGLNLLQLAGPISQIPRSPRTSERSNRPSAYRSGSTSPSPSGPCWGAPSGHSACVTACSTTPGSNHIHRRTP
ncbi:hypothetical protein Jiend_22320 [Micromonospora endophytica]|uniref:hypothetical protein n=1 Tax=Micromonospora endophytica TaxID=515350 RepID=UPI001C325DB9|nr:hypothetical protein [Micromonospora endophytica]BCJ58810.1 hypothetical protein Jiend_22320 [Micromonospora endophytica]